MTETKPVKREPQNITINTGGGVPDWVTLALLGAIAVGGFMVYKKYFPQTPEDVDEGEIAPADAVLATKSLDINVMDPQAPLTVNLAYTIERQGRPALGQGWYSAVDLVGQNEEPLAQLIIPSLVGWGFENDPTQQVSREVPIGLLPAGSHTVTVKIRAREYPELFGQSTGQYAVRNLTMSVSSSGCGGVGSGTGYEIIIDQVNPYQGQIVFKSIADNRPYQIGETAMLVGVGTGYAFARHSVATWIIKGHSYANDIDKPIISVTAPDGSNITIKNFPGDLVHRSEVSFKVTGNMEVGATMTLF